MVRAIVGANWGDEGKGKITDMLASESDIVVRFQGGANAGHTIINDYGRFALHLLPSGVCTPGVVNVLGPGVALDIEFFLKELAAIEQQGLPAPKILISERAQVLMPYHVALDCYEEERLGKNSFGSTKSGIAPFYGDKFQKIGLQLCQLYYPDVLREKLAHALDIKNAMIVNLYHREPVDLEALIVKLTELAERIRPYVADTDAYMMQAVREGKKILLEGQLGTLRDPDHGIYPMVTSSWLATARWARAFRSGASKRSSRSRRRIPPAWARARSRRSCSAMRPRSCASAAATAANTARPPAARAAWAGLTAWRPATAARCRARRKSR